MPIHSVIALTRDLDTPLSIVPLRHHLVSGDALGDRFDIAVTRGAQAVPLTGAGVRAYFIRSADGYTVPIPGSASGNVASVTLPASCYTVPGRFTLTVKAALGGVDHALWVGEGAVLRATTDALIDPDHTIPDLGELLGMIAQIEAAVNAAQTAASSANSAAGTAHAAASNAQSVTATALDAVRTLAPWENVTATVTMLDASATPVVTITDTGSGKQMAFRLPRGLTGATPNLKIGTVRTGEPGTSVIATITGTAEAPRLDLTIPRGDAGSIESLTINGVRAQSGTIALKPSDLGAVAKTGDTMSGNLTVEKVAPRIGVSNTDTGTGIDLRMTTGGDGGLYDVTGGSWMLRKTPAGETRLFGSADTLTTPRRIGGVPFDGSADISLTPSDVGAVWKAGDTLSLANVVLNGYVTNATSTIYVGLSLGKPIEAASITVGNTVSGDIRSSSGLVTPTGGVYQENNTVGGLTVTVFSVHRETGNIMLRLTNGNALVNVANNSVVSVRITGLTLNFS